MLTLVMSQRLGPKFWIAVLTDLRNCGIKDVFFLACDGLKGLREMAE